MRKTNCLCYLFLLVSCILFSQEEKEGNPVVFAEFYLGAAGGEASGLLYGTGVHYQEKNNLFSLRYTGTEHLGISHARAGFILLPFPERKSSMGEVALLYGLRNVREGHSLGFSIGPAYSFYSLYQNEEQEQINSVGLALETNIRWFKKEKRPYRIYGIIPVGNPTAFGHSYGFKLSGNVSRTWYAGISFVMSMGWHKVY